MSSKEAVERASRTLDCNQLDHYVTTEQMRNILDALVEPEKPKRMKGNPYAPGAHYDEHDQHASCRMFGCEPVDAPRPTWTEAEGRNSRVRG